MLEIFDTIVKVSLGALIAAGSGFLVEIYRRRAERSRQKEERYREGLEKPVVAFVDEMLVLMSKAYWDKVDGKESQLAPLLEAFREKEAPAEARVAAMKSPAVTDSFRALDDRFTSFRAELADGSLAKARNALREAHSHAGAFFRALY